MRSLFGRSTRPWNGRDQVRLWLNNLLPQTRRYVAVAFQRVLDRVSGPEMYPHVFVYLHDIIIVTRQFKEHLEWLEKVLGVLRNAGLAVNREKSDFCKAEVRYLGFVVNHDGLQVDPEKTRAAMEFPAPKTLWQMRRFLGMASWYRRFIPEFATIAEPLTKKNQRWV